MYFNKDSFNQNKPLEFYVCRPNNQVAAPVIGFENDRMTLNMLDISELSFEVPEYVYLPQKKETVLNPCFSYLSQYMRIMDSCGRIFRINTEPEILETADGRIKTVSADSLECELQDKDIIGLAINMGNELSAEWYDENLNPLGVPENYITFANDSEKRLSLMDILLDYAPNWKLGHVDTELRALRRSFEIDASDLYAVLTQDVARAFKCVFLFDTATRTINAFKAANVGRDTHIYLSVHNLIRSKTVSPSSDTIYTSFSVLADDNQDILSFANFGSREITNYDYFMNPIWFREETIAKYRAYQTNIETKRERYMQITRDYNYLNTLVADIYDRVPDDSCETAWTGRSLEELNTELSGYQAAVKYLEDLHTANGVLNIEDSADYGVYISFKDVTIPKLTAQIKAVESGKLKPENTLKWETNWDLYGIHELENRLLVYTDAAAIYQAYADDYNPDIHTESEQLYQMNHQLYLENIEYIHQIEAAIDRRKARLSEYQAEMDRLQAERAEITAYSRMDAPVHGFTSEELEIFESLTVHTDYTNENVFVTDFDDEMTKVDLAKELYDSACEQLAVESRPQLSMQIDLDSFLSMTKYNGFTDELEAGNFIRVGMNSDDAEKLRIIRISFHPSDLSSGLDLKFSSMITTYNRRDDYTYLTGGSRSRSGKNKISAGMTSEDLTTALSALLNSKFASFISSPVFGNASSQNIEAVLGTFEVVLTDYLKTKDLTAEVANIGKLSADSAFVTYLQSHFASVATLDAAQADIGTLTTNYSEIVSLLSGTASMGSLQSIVISANNAVIDAAYLEDLMAKNITVNHLKAEDINTNKIGLSSEDGSLNITGAAMQFSDDTGVRLQLGKDAEGNFSFILRGENSAVLIDEKGLHENAVTDGLIKTRMLEDGAVDTGKVNWESAGASTDGNGHPVWKSGNIIVEEDGATVTEKFQTISSDIDVQAGEITQLIADTTIVKEDGTTVSLQNAYNMTKDTLTEYSKTISDHGSALEEQGMAIASNSTQISNFYQGLDEFKQTISETTSLLANMALGESLYINNIFNEKTLDETNYPDDSKFEPFTFLKKYKCGNTSASVIKSDPTTPIQNGYTLRFSAADWTTPEDKYIGGVSFNITPRYNAKFVGKFIAKIPEGYSLECIDNIAGTTPVMLWLGADKTCSSESGKSLGTGKWEEYYYYIQCDTSGPLGTPDTSLLFNLCLSGESAPSASAPVTWYLCYAGIFDVTNISGIEERVRNNESMIRQTQSSIQTSIEGITINHEPLDENGNGTGEVTKMTLQEMYNTVVMDLHGTKSQLREVSETASDGISELQDKYRTINDTVEGLEINYGNINTDIDHRIDGKLATYKMSSEQWMANFKKALDKKFGVESVEVRYYISSSNTQPTDGQWIPHKILCQPEKYYWQKTITTFTDDETVVETVPVLITTPIESPSYIMATYALMDSDTPNTEGAMSGASESCPLWEPNKYIWTQTVFVHEENLEDDTISSKAFLSPIPDRSWEAYSEKIGTLIGTTVANATISSDGFVFKKENRSSIFNTDEISVYKDSQLLFGIDEQYVTAGRLKAPDGADFDIIKIKPMPNVTSGGVTLHGIAFVKSGGAS